MKQILHMALKDIKLIVRDRMGFIFIVVFPIVMGVFFGIVMSGMSSGSGGGKMRVVLIDQDQSAISQKFTTSLQKNEKLDVQFEELEAAREGVRKGNLVGMIVLPVGFGETAGVFWNDPPKIQLGLDPSRTAEAAMLEGFILQGVGELVGERFQDPAQFKPMVDQAKAEVIGDTELTLVQRTLITSLLGSFDSMIDSIDQLQKEGSNGGSQQNLGPGMQFAEIEPIDVSRQVDPQSMEGQLKKLRSSWDISFPQAMLWGVLGCVAGFSISIARERTLGTLMRLQVAPINRPTILAGKALACFLTTIGVIAMLTVIGVALGMQPASYAKLALASVCLAFCFVGIMMFMSVLGKTEQGVSGAEWAINMSMAMLGGCMIPAMFMPAVMQPFSWFSPVRWGIYSLEGAIWREFSWAEMGLPFLALIGFGIAGLIAAVGMMRRESRV